MEQNGVVIVKIRNLALVQISQKLLTSIVMHKNKFVWTTVFKDTQCEKIKQEIFSQEFSHLKS